MAGIAKALIDQMGENGLKQALKRYGLSLETATEDDLRSLYSKQNRMARPNTVVSEPSSEEVSKFSEGVNKPRPTPPMFGEAPVEYASPRLPANKDASDWNVPLKSEYAQDAMEEARQTNTPIAEVMASKGRPYTQADLDAPTPSPMMDFQDYKTPLPKAGMSTGGKAALAAGTAAGLGYASTLGDKDVHDYLTAKTPPPQEKKAPEMAMAAMSTSPVASHDTVTPPGIKDMLAGFVKTMPEMTDTTDWNASLDNIKDKRQDLANQLKRDVLDASAAANVASASVEKRELIETITNAIGQIASGMYGMKSGLDLSGAKFNKTDWNSKLEHIRANLKDNIARLTDAQQLDQSVLSEEKDNLLRRKDDLTKDYERKFHQWAAKGDILGKEQGTSTDRAKMQFDADKFNVEMDLRSQEVMRKIAKEGKPPKEQISSGIKEAGKVKEDVSRRWNQLASELGSPKLSDEQKLAKKTEMEGLDVKYTSMTGTPLLPAIGKDGMPSLTPRNYAEIDPETLVEEASGMRAKGVEAAVAGFRSPELKQLKGSFIQQRDQYLAKYAEEYVAKGEPVGVAFSKAQQQYNSKLKNMFDIERAYRKGDTK